ncbi:hypothetical protein NDU88_000724 [Pleurodeles waltl]|uniref:Uncharacterized protein n=1 Tax=Pleurodeles waltl TaxID=8319 RepID=A0AAV7LAZ0_PLEWA|nr:hypothetical protein NDU88_000724 [Pleurodeles waltl]
MASPACAGCRAGGRTWRPAADPGGVWPGTELHLGATRLSGRACGPATTLVPAALPQRRHCWARDFSGAWRLRRARKRPGRRQAVVVKPLRGTLRFVVAHPWFLGRNRPENSGGPPKPLTEDTRQCPVEGGEGCGRRGLRRVKERRSSGWEVWAERACEDWLVLWGPAI